jgi:hypothetical protein
MKKNYIYLLVVLVLAALAYFFVFQRDSGSFRGDETAFGVKDTASIGKIFLADLKGNTIEVERSGDGWVMADGKPARQDLLNTVLLTFNQMEVKVPVAKSMYDKVVRDIAGNHIKVEIYNRSDKKIRSFYIGPISSTFRGNFMLVEGSETPFVVQIPGFDGFISSRFDMEPLNWKDRTVFSTRPDNIAKVSIDYPRVPDSSFVIERSVEGEYTFTNKGQTMPQFNPEIGNFYLNYFKKLNCELFIDNSYKLDSLKNHEPVCIITVTDQKGNSRKADIYYRAVNYRTKMQFTYEGKDINFDLDKYYGVINEGADLALIQNFVFGKLFVGPAYFYRQRPSDSNVLVEDIMKDAEGETIDLMK